MQVKLTVTVSLSERAGPMLYAEAVSKGSMLTVTTKTCCCSTHQLKTWNKQTDLSTAIKHSVTITITCTCWMQTYWVVGRMAKKIWGLLFTTNSIGREETKTVKWHFCRRNYKRDDPDLSIVMYCATVTRQQPQPVNTAAAIVYSITRKGTTKTSE